MKRILIVDDEKIERNGVRHLLMREKQDFEILEASNGRDALELVKEKKPDILFTDIKMPFMTGLELSEKVHELSPKTVIVIFSGYNDFEFAKEAMKNGVMDYMLKPINPAEFKKMLKTVMEKLEEREEDSRLHQKNQNFLEQYFLQKYMHTGREEVLIEAAEAVDISWWKKITRLILLETVGNFFEECREDFGEELYREIGVPFHYLNLDRKRSLLLFEAGIKADYAVMAQHIHNYLLSGKVKCFVALSEQFENGSKMAEAFSQTELLMENRFYRQDLWVFLPDMEMEGKDNYEVVVELLEKMEEDIHLRDITHLWEHFHKFEDQKKQIGQFSHIYVKFSCSNIIRELYRDMHVSMENCNSIIEKMYQCTSMQDILKMLEENIRLYEEKVFATKNNARSDVEKVKSYIYEHYAEELSVESLGGGGVSLTGIHELYF